MRKSDILYPMGKIWLLKAMPGGLADWLIDWLKHCVGSVQLFLVLLDSSEVELFCIYIFFTSSSSLPFFLMK